MEENKRQTCPSVISSLKRVAAIMVISFHTFTLLYFHTSILSHFHTFTLSHLHLLEEGGSHSGNYLPHFSATHSGLFPPPVLDQISFLFYLFLPSYLYLIISFVAVGCRSCEHQKSDLHASSLTGIATRGGYHVECIHHHTEHRASIFLFFVQIPNT